MNGVSPIAWLIQQALSADCYKKGREVMPFKTLDDLGDIAGKRVFVRVDLNVPMAEGRVTDETRLRALVPTVSELSAKGAKVLLLAHFGRPKGAKHSELSVSMVLDALQRVLDREIMFVPEIAGDVVAQSIGILADGDVALLENSRFYPGEEKNDPELAKAIAANGDIYVNDAFSAAHRAHVTTEALAHILPAYAGRSMEAELKALESALGNAEHPVAAVVGGAKVSTKLDVLQNLVTKVDHLIIGGGMANTFLAARGIDVGKSLCEHDLAETAIAILDAADASGCTVHLPYDVVTSREFRANPPIRTVNVHEVAADEMILDVGPAAVEALGDVLKNCRTLVWNGPMGAFEMAPFDAATVALAKMAAALTKEGSLVSVAGGGDTVAAMEHAGVAADFSFISTAGGAFLEWMEGKPLPGVDALTQN
jgi:phosphoglycerate kinase